jgi:hypothetical protein
VDGQATVDSAESLSSFFLTLDATDEVAAASLLQATNDEHLAGSEHSMGTGIAAIAAEAAAEVLTKAIPQKLAVQSYLQPHVITSDKTVLNPVIGGASSVLLRRFVLKLIILPRQARDKHRESRETRGRFLQGWPENAALSPQQVASSSWMCGTTASDPVRNTASYGPLAFICLDRLRTHIRSNLKNATCCFRLHVGEAIVTVTIPMEIYEVRHCPAISLTEKRNR